MFGKKASPLPKELDELPEPEEEQEEQKEELEEDEETDEEELEEKPLPKKLPKPLPKPEPKENPTDEAFKVMNSQIMNLHQRLQTVEATLFRASN